MRVLIIEDEPAAVAQLQFFLEKIDKNIEVIASLDSVSEALVWFQSEHNIDLIFSDIQLSDGLSFEIFEIISSKSPIIFITAFDEYAIRAFKHNSIDYVLKPVEEKAIRFGIEKYKSQNLIDSEKLRTLISNKTFTENKYNQSFLVKYRDAYLPIKIEDIAFFYIDSSVVLAKLFDEKVIVINDKLESLEEKLDPDLFLRVSRQFILSKESILSIRSHPTNRALIKTKPESSFPIIVSKEKVRKVKNWIKL